MIITKLIGGLGNQMFQYSAGYHIAKLSGTTLKMDAAGFEKYKLHKVAIHHLNVNYEQSVLSNKEANRITNSYGIRGLLKKYGLLHSKITTFAEDKPGFRAWMVKKYTEDVYLDGFWQSERYFKPSENEIRDRLQVITPPSETNKNFLDKINSANAVSVHIRRADYVTNNKPLSFHGI